MHIYHVSQKMYGVTDYQYFKNGNTQQCNIFRHGKKRVNIIVIKLCVKFQSRISNVTKVMNVRGMMGQTGHYDKTINLKEPCKISSDFFQTF